MSAETPRIAPSAPRYGPKGPETGGNRQIETYAEHAARLAPIVAELERIAHRLRQGAISERRAALRLRVLADDLDPVTPVSDS
jgi:hypothetical protein